ncbi:mRNA stability protein [Cercospora beticola]|uniref:mRNA stability protein n=1 Tax=Cercospora beticola TaxID=122368 RepID=A0A2G5HN30_CERBT|nr:mRNA stability protein [Cercospora beticola]PIA93940.1 mRNA stability protein [Cercospora beticola]
MSTSPTHEQCSSSSSAVTRDTEDLLDYLNFLDDFPLYPQQPVFGNVVSSSFPSYNAAAFLEPTPRIAVAAPHPPACPFPPPPTPPTTAYSTSLEVLGPHSAYTAPAYPTKEGASQLSTKRKRALQAQDAQPSPPAKRPFPSSSSSSSSNSTMALNPHKQNKVDVSVRLRPISLPVQPNLVPDVLIPLCESLTPFWQSLTEEEQKLFRLYGKLPNKKDLFSKKLQERKYFDSGDYAMSKAGKSDGAGLGGGLGREHPTPENIPHLSQQQSAGTPTSESGPRASISGGPTLHPTTSSGNGQMAGSPVKEASHLHRGSSVDEEDVPEEVKAAKGTENSESSAIPIRQ